jgi:hypothetical protein
MNRPHRHNSMCGSTTSVYLSRSQIHFCDDLGYSQSRILYPSHNEGDSTRRNPRLTPKIFLFCGVGLRQTRQSEKEGGEYKTIPESGKKLTRGARFTGKSNEHYSTSTTEVDLDKREDNAHPMCV